MQRLPLRLAALALACTGLSAQAVYINPEGTGQVLLFPYYTVNAGQATVISLVNAGEKSKLLAVTFREGYNSREVLSFNVVLAPHDTWTGTVYGDDQDGPARLITRDESCTLPSKAQWTGPLLGGSYEKTFYAWAYNGRSVDGGLTTGARTREGHLEVIERLELSGALAAAVENQHPPHCAALQAISAQAAGLNPPGGDLYGSFAVIDVAEGTLFGGTATAVDDFSRVPLINDYGTLNWLHAARSRGGAFGETDAVVPIDGRLQTLVFANNLELTNNAGPNALSALLMTENLYGDISREASLGSHSEWVITSPTRFMHTADPRGQEYAQLAPFNGRFNDPAPDSSCTPFTPRAYDREGRSVNILRDTNPPPGSLPQHALCYGTNVVHFSDLAADGSTPLLGSRLGTKVKPDMEAGSVVLELATVQDSTRRNTLPAGVRGPTLLGLPVIGFEVVRYINNNVTPGVLSNYAAATPLRRSVRCGNAAGEAQDCP
ncbi:hypothetical protein [Tahibacter harae]|uniref:hypothetical protein n=1 Tax=Tahibacter harae TaxID=2963937 RepID=UPI00210CAFD1|nr:hypothetical protein [Tahibacter harae]